MFLKVKLAREVQNDLLEKMIVFERVCFSGENEYFSINFILSEFV